MYAQRVPITITVDASGDGTGYISSPGGKLTALIYTKIDYADGVDFTVTVNETAEAIWSQSNVNSGVAKYPRVAVQDVLGAAALFASGGEAVVEPITIAQDDRIKIVVAQGGNITSGTFHAIFE